MKRDLTPSEIDEIIRSADIDELCDPQTGDCVSVAVAIKEVFGGEYVCGYQSPADYKPAHATVDIDGVLFDGGGTTSVEALHDVATSGLKKDEVHGFDEHVGEVSSLRSNALYDESVKRRVEQALRDQLEE